MPKIFISYRRDDSNTITGHIRERLVRKFGKQNVFRDFNSIPLGADFRDVIEEGVASCDVLLAVIGDKWVNITDKNGNKRLNNPDDFVRIEVETALRIHKIKVIPVLVNGVGMPSEAELPSTLRKLPYLNAAVIRNDPDFDTDVTNLIASLSGSRFSRWLIVAAVIVGLLIVGLGLFLTQGNRPSPTAKAVVLDAPTETDPNQSTPIGLVTDSPTDTPFAASDTSVPTNTPPIPTTMPTNTLPPPTATAVPSTATTAPTDTPLSPSNTPPPPPPTSVSTLVSPQSVSTSQANDNLPHLMVMARCAGDTANFYLSNNGTSMRRSVQWTVYLNGRSFSTGSTPPMIGGFLNLYFYHLDSVDGAEVRLELADNKEAVLDVGMTTITCPPVSGGAVPTLTATSVAKGYPCEATVVSRTSNNVELNVVHSLPRGNAALVNLVHAGALVKLLRKYDETTTQSWYEISDSNEVRLGWIPVEYIVPSVSCPS